MTRQKLPIGIQTFAKLREEGCYYVDKTPWLLRLVREGSFYFLSRPRCFGKSLLIDTLAELFEGNRALFDGLHAASHWDWSTSYPVIRISFADGVLHSAERLRQRILDNLRQNGERLGVTFPPDLDVPGQFGELIRQARARHGQRAVVLVDEYDKPILDNITDPAIAREMRDGLRDFYSVIKGQDAHIRFAMLTGVSKFSKVSLFSGLNNLRDITVSPDYSAICGYTDEDIDTVFAPELPGLDRAQIRTWYNGYNWTGTSVYNPFDLLLLFQEREFHPYWFQTGTPTFLIDILTQRGVFTPQLQAFVAQENLLGSFDVEQMTTEALLFQTGYLTVGSVWRIPGRAEFTLKYPNLEVQASLNESLLQRLSGDPSVPGVQVSQLYRLLQARDFAGLQALFTAFFASIPNDWYRNSPIARFEGYYASIFYSHFAALGLDIRLEDVTNRGRIDMTVLFEQQVWLFEFKVVELLPDGRALQQIKDRAYADKYRARGETMHLIGVEFSQTRRSVVGFEVETLPCAHA